MDTQDPVWVLARAMGPALATVIPELAARVRDLELVALAPEAGPGPGALRGTPAPEVRLVAYQQEPEGRESEDPAEEGMVPGTAAARADLAEAAPEDQVKWNSHRSKKPSCRVFCVSWRSSAKLRNRRTPANLINSCGNNDLHRSLRMHR